MIETVRAARAAQPPPPHEDAAVGAATRDELEALKLLILAMWRELRALEAAGSSARAAGPVDLAGEMRRFESDLIRCALIRTGNRQRRAARLLGMSVATLNAKIKRYHIDTDRVLNHAAALRHKKKEGAGE
jgi:DNA-binding NtrC family response regulator